MGLLDNFLGSGWDDPKSQAVMALAGGLLNGDFGAGVQGYGSVMANAKDAAMKRKILEMQAAEYQQKMDMQNAAIEVAKRKEAALPEIFRAPSQGAPVMSMDSMLPPELRAGTPTVPAVAPSAGGIDVMKALQAKYSPAEIEALAKLKNINLEEVARTISGQDGSGRPVTFQKDKFGRDVGQPIAEWKAPVEVGQGDRRTFVSPIDFSTKASFQVNQSPDSKASNAVAWANNGLTAQRLAFDQQQAGKPTLHDGQWVYPPTFQNPNGNAAPVPGYQKPLGEGPKKQLAGIQSLNGAIGEYLNELKDWNATSIASPDARASMGTKYNNMMLQAKEAYNLGVLNGPDYQILTSIVTDPASGKGMLTSNKALAKQASELSRIMQTINAPAAAQGATQQATPQKTPVKTGTYGGKKVVQYSDGSIEYAD